MDKAPSTQSSHVLTRWLFLRLLGVVYFCAFASLWTQVRGLIGNLGILPVGQFLAAAHQQVGAPGCYLLCPTLFWLNASDHALTMVCCAGTLVSLLLICGILPVPSLAILWLLYLSLVNVGQDFLGYQWDVLLLETGFLAIFLAPMAVLPRLSRETEPSRAILWLLRALLFRLMLLSGIVKLASGDPTWRALTAMTYHYWTQPLPTPLAWYAWQLPLWFQKLSTALVFAIELIAPFLIFGPRLPRLVAAALLAGLQLLILLTGNFAFFNWLTIALCVLLLDDAALRAVIAKRFKSRVPERAAEVTPRNTIRRWVTIFVTVLVASLAVLQLADQLNLPIPGQGLLQLQEPLHLVNPYGLFAVMTTSRPEIVIEGSDDDARWLPYQLRYQPQDVAEAPKWIAPFQPRLDWQLWFAALGDASGAPWMRGFLARLLQGSPDVLALLKTNPFPNRPPRYVRVVLCDYRFTDIATRRATGDWWVRQERGEYFPPVSLD